MKTIYSKLLLISVGVIIAGFILLTSGLNLAYKSYIIDQTQSELTRLASDFNQLLNDLYSLDNLPTQSVRDELYRLERYASLKVWIVPSGGNMVVTEEGADINLIEKELDIQEIQRVLNTKKPIFRAANYINLPENQYYTLIYPITVKIGRASCRERV